MRKPHRYPAFDVIGRHIRVGDWVRVVSVPESIAAMRPETKRVFSAAVGKTFQIEAFDALGCAELDLTPKVGLDTIWIEPFCVQRIRRPKRYSRRFRKVLAMKQKLERPRWSFRYVAKYRARDNPWKLAQRLSDACVNERIGHGWYVLETKQELHGSLNANDQRVSSKRRLEQCRLELKKGGFLELLQLGRVRLSK